jgi:glycosyltransferase involved in cell wall biosynthesis
MKTILITAYDINPYKGSESGMGWNFVLQASRFNKIKVVTRKNNRKNIDKYINENNVDMLNLDFFYYDLPYYLRFWKNGKRGSSIYFYLWQLLMPLYIKKVGLVFDIAHNLNFHTDAFPSFLWVFHRQPLIWGPINHHEKIDSRFIINSYGVKAFLNDRLVWVAKLILWNLDPFIQITKRRSKVILGGSSAVRKRLGIRQEKYLDFSSVGVEWFEYYNDSKPGNFNLISVGRFVPLKGFDVAIQSYIHFLKNNPKVLNAKLTLIGSGPSEPYLRELSKECPKNGEITFINWMDRGKLAKFYSKSSVFLFPSHEGAGMVVVEAMSYGLPVICFNNNGPGELIDDKSGIRIPYSDYQETINNFSLAIKSVYFDESLYLFLSKGARDRFKKYTWDEKGLFLKKVYENVDD